MRPPVNASAAPMASPEKSILRASLRGTQRSSSTAGVVQKRPILTPGVAKVEAAVANTMSHAATCQFMKTNIKYLSTHMVSLLILKRF